jgi:hypothetical protein
LFGDASASRAAAADRTDVFYAGVEGMEMYSLPTATSETLARLALHQPVTRIGLARGYANVSTEAGVVGWVDNANLLWRLPAARPATGLAHPPPAAAPKGQRPPPSRGRPAAPRPGCSDPGSESGADPAAPPTRKSSFSIFTGRHPLRRLTDPGAQAPAVEPAPAAPTGEPAV